MNMPSLMSPKLILGNIKKLHGALNPKGPTMTLLNETALQCLLHAHEHGDVTLCERLYEAIGGAAGAVRGEALKFWVAKNSPITIRNDKWAMKKGWTKEMFNLDAAAEKSFWEFAGPERPPVAVSAESILNVIHGLMKRIDKAVENGNFKGDATKTKELVSNVISLADEKAKKLTPQELGADIGETEQVILGGFKETAVA